MPKILSSICSALDWTLGACWRFDEEQQLLRCEKIVQMASVQGTDFELATAAAAFHPGEGLPGRVWSTGKPLWIADVTRDPGFRRGKAAARNGLHGAFAFPLQAHGHVVGVLEFFSGEVRAPDPELLDTVTAIAAQIGRFIQRTEALEQALACEAGKAAIVEHALDGILITGDDGDIAEINPAAERIFGLSRRQALGTPLLELIVLPGGATALSPELIGHRMEAHGRRRDRSEFPIELAITRHVSHGKGETFTAFIRDISDQKRAEEVLRASEAQLQEHNEHLSVLVHASEVLNSTLDYEDTLTNIVGLALPALGDLGFLEVLREDGGVRRIARAYQDPASQAILDGTGWEQARSSEAFSSGRAVLRPHIDDHYLERAAGSYEHLQALRALGIRSAIGMPITYRGRRLGALTLCFVSSGRRHTGIDLLLGEELARRAASALANARLYETAKRERERAEEASLAKDEFLAAVSHELRTPLTAILGWSHLLRQGHLPEEQQKRAMECVERNARAQAHLVDDLLDVMQMATGKLRLDLRPCDLTLVISEAFSAVQAAADAKQISIRLDLSPVDPVLGDPERLRQVIWNLLANAVKFSPRGSSIEVTLARSGENALITVRDFGQGIVSEFLPHVFEQFRQADGGSTRSHGGLGLGLTIVQRIVELHGGTVRADSGGDDLGATFSVLLPLARTGDT